MNPAASEGAITRISIAGHGVEAWLAANHLLAALGPRQVEISIHPVEGSDAWDRLYSTWPAGPDDGLASIGLGGHGLAASCNGSFSLGVQHGEQFVPYGGIGIDFAGVPFHHHWQRLQGGQEADSYFSWSVAHEAASKQAFAPPQPRNAIGPLQHATARHLDISLLTTVLRDRAMRHGVTVANEPGGAADLILDCSGPQRILTADRNWQAAEGIPAYRIDISTENSTETPTPWHSVQPADNGWSIAIPGNGWKSRIKLAAGETGEGHSFKPGHVEQAWVGNTLALGTAAAVFLPAEPVQPRFLASSLRRMVSLLPGRDCAPQETNEYNHLQQTELAEIEDLLSAYEYARRGKLDMASTHDKLSMRLQQFMQRGWVAPADSDFLQPSDWARVWIQLGIRPVNTSRLTNRLPLAEIESRMKQLQEDIKRTASEFPSHRDFLRAVQTAAGSPGNRPA